MTSESTMKDAKLAAAHGDSVSKLFVADTQEQARGRFGRPFFAEPGRGIYSDDRILRQFIKPFVWME